MAPGRLFPVNVAVLAFSNKSSGEGEGKVLLEKDDAELLLGLLLDEDVAVGDLFLFSSFFSWCDEFRFDCSGNRCGNGS